SLWVRCQLGIFNFAFMLTTGVLMFMGGPFSVTGQAWAGFLAPAVITAPGLFLAIYIIKSNKDSLAWVLTGPYLRQTIIVASFTLFISIPFNLLEGSALV